MRENLVSQRAAVIASANRLKDRIDSKWGLSGHDTGHHDLNLAIGGWIRGKLSVLAARSKSGKTAASVPMIPAARRIVSDRRAEILFMTWEMTPDAIVDRHVCREASVSSRMLHQGAKLLPEFTRKKIENAYRDAMNLPVQYQTMTLDIESVKRVTGKFALDVRQKEKDEGIEIIPVVLIDFLNMAMFNASQNKTYGIQEYMVGLKGIANNEGMAIMPLAQISREVDKFGRQTNTVVEPTLADLSDSKSIEDLSDNVILMHNPSVRGGQEIRDPLTGENISAKNRVLFKVDKCRDYGSSEFLCQADMRFFDIWALGHPRLYDYTSLYTSKEFWTDRLKDEFKTTDLLQF